MGGADVTQGGPRIASVSCAPALMTGLSEVIGSWKIIAISPPAHAPHGPFA